MTLQQSQYPAFRAITQSSPDYDHAARSRSAARIKPASAYARPARPPRRHLWLDPARPQFGMRYPPSQLLLSAPVVRQPNVIYASLATCSANCKATFSASFACISQIISYQLIVQKLIFDNLYSVNYPRCTELPQIGNKPTLFRCAVRDAGAMQRAADLGRSNGGVMRIGRTIIIQAILVLGAAGSIAASVAVPATTVAAPSSHVHTVAMAPNSWYHM
jgi:hypothetical protein